MKYKSETNGTSPPTEKPTSLEGAELSTTGVALKETNVSNPHIVDWQEDDPEDPRNWKTSTKVFNTSLILVLVLLTPLASSMFAPAVPQVLKDFNTSSQIIAELVVTIYILGFAIGPLLISPLSEIYGRYPVYVVCNCIFIVFTVACALSKSVAQLVVFRFLAGCFGVCPVALGGASISDLIPPEKRGAFMSLFGTGPLLGPVIGPICGAFVSANLTWRWTFWVIAIAYGFFTILHALLCRETYAPVVLARRTQSLRRSTGDDNLVSKLDDGLSGRDRILRALVRPMKMLLFSPIVNLTALYCAVIYGVLYLLYTTYTFVFEEFYHFSTKTIGLVYIGGGAGMLIGLFLIGSTSDWILKNQAARRGGDMKPEARLLPLVFMCWLIPCGLFIYGWTVQYHEQWAVPLFGTLLFGIGIIASMICIQQYLIDAYTKYAASVIAANTVLRSIVGVVLPLAGLKMYQKLGLGWGNSLIAFISLAMAPIPLVFFLCGERIRKSAQLTL